MEIEKFRAISCENIGEFISLFSNTNEEFKIRTNLSTEKEFLNFFKRVTFGASVMFHHYNKPGKVGSSKPRYVYSGTFVCHHSGMKTKSKNLKCPSKLSVRIKKVNYQARCKDSLVEDYPCFLSLDGRHTHEIRCIDSISRLTTRSPAKRELVECFRDGMGPQEALNHMKSNMSPTKIANRSFLPNQNTAYYEHTKFTAAEYGGLDGESLYHALNTLQKKYPEAKLLLQTPTDKLRFCYFIQTPLMARVLQQVQQSSELIFMDSTTGLDQTNSSLTTIHTWTAAGAVPIGLAITNTQTTQEYIQVLECLKSCSKTTGFYGKIFPECFMTDDATAEQEAVSKVFPNSKGLLCHFHFLQAMWRWLWDKDHNIALVDRKPLMLLVREMVGSLTAKTLFKNQQKIYRNAVARKYPNFIGHIKNKAKNASEWALCYRRLLKTRGHNTNNFCERAMGTIKSNVLERKKAFNVAALAEALITKYDKIIEDRLIDVATKRVKAAHNPKLNNEIVFEDIVREGDSNLFCVKSKKNPENWYFVDMDVPICVCPAGAGGKPCKHMAAILSWYGDTCKFSIPKIETNEELHQLLFLAIGDEALSPKYNLLYQTPKNQESKVDTLMEVDAAGNGSSGGVNVKRTFQISESGNSQTEEFAVKYCLKLIKSCSSKFSGDGTMEAFVQMSRTLVKLRNGSKSSFQAAFHNFGKSYTASKKRTRTGSLIKVQPTAIARRKATQSKGAAPLLKGRVKKRKHNLMQNVNNNKRNATKH